MCVCVTEPPFVLLQIIQPKAHGLSDGSLLFWATAMRTVGEKHRASSAGPASFLC